MDLFRICCKNLSFITFNRYISISHAIGFCAPILTHSLQHSSSRNIKLANNPYTSDVNHRYLLSSKVQGLYYILHSLNENLGVRLGTWAVVITIAKQKDEVPVGEWRPRIANSEHQCYPCTPNLISFIDLRLSCARFVPLLSLSSLSLSLFLLGDS